jgi:hypothetical protein
MSYRQTRPLVPSFRLKFRNFRLRKAKGLLLQRHATSERNHNCPPKIEEPGNPGSLRWPADREIRDERLIADLRELHKTNYSVYGVNKMHAAMKRRGWRLGREQTRRLMRKAGLRGVQRGKPVFTTIADPAAARPADLVNRQFRAAAPNRLWVADLVRREALFDRAEVRDHRFSVVAAAD